MKRLLLASSVALAISGSAFAADMSPPPPALKAPPPPPPTWTGCYIDGGVGYGMWNVDHTTTDFTGLTTVKTTDGGRGWLGRVGAGCDYQVAPKWVIGVLGDYDFMDLTGSNSPSLIDPVSGSPLTANMKEQGAWYAGARIGYLIAPSILSYIDGGYTETRFTQGNEFLTATGTPFGFQFQNFTSQGWFLGGGVETALSDWWSGLPAGLYVRTEYRFSSYDHRNINEFAVATGVPDGNVERMTPYVQTVTTSLVWKWNWAAPGTVHW